MLRAIGFVGVTLGHISNQFTHGFHDSTIAEVVRLADGLLDVHTSVGALHETAGCRSRAIGRWEEHGLNPQIEAGAIECEC